MRWDNISKFILYTSTDNMKDHSVRKLKYFDNYLHVGEIFIRVLESQCFVFFVVIANFLF